MPAPIIASPLSPNTTGVSVEAPSPSNSPSPRIHLPTSGSYLTSYLDTKPRSHGDSGSTSLSSTPSQSSPPSRYQRSNTLDSPTWAPTRDSSTTPRRPTSSYGAPTQRSTSPEKFDYISKTTNRSPERPPRSTPPSVLSSTPSPSVMSPPVYKSSYMNKKLNGYGDNLSSGRKLGRHLPRIASGDATDEVQAERKVARVTPPDEIRPTNLHLAHRESPRRTPSKRDSVMTLGDDVVGVPGRLRLKAFSPPPTPLPSSRLTRGLWADTQRHLLQAYEYLCHVGEAQQWIEGCLGEELGLGVVELEEGLRNGVVLAKLVRAFQGEAAVPRIYEAPKLNFRHSDNINHFFLFVRGIGLPEGFIFELTDLYEKKNLPKVIYCIHALSHLLARRGMAERIGNLLGHLQFSEDQLQQAQKGLKDANVPMPNFGNVGKELAKEINEEPEEEVETEEERRDRLLLENEVYITALQATARGFLLRKRLNYLRGKMQVGQRYTLKLQAQARGALRRKVVVEQRKTQVNLLPWVIALQAVARGVLARRAWRYQLRRIRLISSSVARFQAHIRGVLQRRRFTRLKTALRTSRFSVAKLQAVARAQKARAVHKEIAKTFSRPVVRMAVTSLQAFARGKLARRRDAVRHEIIKDHEINYVALQAQCRGVIMRRRLRSQLARLEDVTGIVIRIQSAVRTYLARKRLLLLIRGLRRATPTVVGFQARARAILSQQKHQNLNKALMEVKTVTAVNSLQAFSRAALARNRHRELNRKLDFVNPDVVGFQATARGALVRQEYHAWRSHLKNSQHVATILQAMLRGALIRRRHRVRMEHYRANLSKVVKLQSLFRAKETREQYRQLTMGTNVSVGTIKNFVHLLDDSEADFHDEIKLEQLRKEVVRCIRENQGLESEVSDLDQRIALLVENAKNFEDLLKAKKGIGANDAASHAARISLLAAHGDPFAGPNTLDRASRRKLELYQQLFYLLQTHGGYLSSLFLELSAEGAPETSRRFAERVVLTLFGYGQDRREDFLLLKLFQLAIFAEVSSAMTPDDVIHGHPMFISIAVQYARPKQISYIRETFQTIIRDLVNAQDLNLEADPTEIYRSRIALEEMRSGVPSPAPKEVPFYDALNDPNTRAIYIRRLQTLQIWVDNFVEIMRQSTRKMPYGMRFLARETLVALREKFPGAPDAVYVAGLGRIVYYRYIYPVLMAPETFDIVPRSVDIAARKNLAQIATVLTQIFTGFKFEDESPNYIPINEGVGSAISKVKDWLFEVANVPDAETHFHAHEFLDATFQPKSIYISPNEIYTMHSLLSQHQDALVPDPNDPLRAILIELDGVPNLGSDELKDARDTPITLELTNRFADVQDPQAEEKTLWVKAKRAALAVLRVHPNQDLLTSLLTKPTEEEETIWEEIVDAEMENEQIRHHGRQASAIGGDTYRLEDIRTLNFASVKFQALEALLSLEKLGKVSREDNFQGILNAIASDVRSKHRKRIQRQQEMVSMKEALKHLRERKNYFEEQISQYHNYVDSAMTTMQRGKGKKRIVMPFSKQFFHLRDLQRAGETPKYGSFKYSAKKLYDRGILLSIDQYSPRQFDRIEMTFSSDTPGVFGLLLTSSLNGSHMRIAQEDIRMEELLQAKYENRPSLTVLDGKVKVNFENFLLHINKKFYV
ncbi:hypothetical protein BDN72DRAFT_786097 [Pluteus cervinus]|uniref:Uncharacterized protein n=1 Tax=Pluteus cervinus TaxID=181527 RepID=A0ACD3BEA3_9AGAR|nr:hypothetical protein BDN72DRAFT_786097 [Pluteus cervinus]